MHFFQAYRFIGFFMMIPIILATALTIIKCWKIGMYIDILSSISSHISLSLEKESSFFTRLISLVLSLLGVYPQYRAVSIIAMASGKISGDWKEYMELTRPLALIEPVTEGILQLFCQTCILGTLLLTLRTLPIFI